MEVKHSPRHEQSIDMPLSWPGGLMSEPHLGLPFADFQLEDSEVLSGTPDPSQAHIQQLLSNSVDTTSPENFSLPMSSTNFSRSPGPLVRNMSTASSPMQSKAPRLYYYDGTLSASNSQQNITPSHDSKVHQQLGQLTPPPEVTRKISTVENKSTESVIRQAAQRAKTDKSKCGGHTAAQRQAETMKASRDSRCRNKVSNNGNEGDIKRREEYRKKNKLAAAKCRARKRENNARIEERHGRLSAMNSMLKKQVHELRSELITLRAYALEHQDCNCQIAHYNAQQARLVALSASIQPPH